jgi:hypothetical protein
MLKKMPWSYTITYNLFTWTSVHKSSKCYTKDITIINYGSAFGSLPPYLDIGAGRIVKNHITELDISLQMVRDLPFIRGRVNNRFLQSSITDSEFHKMNMYALSIHKS